MEVRNIESMEQSYDSVHHIAIGRVDGPDWVTIDGIGKDSLIYFHDSNSGNGLGIFGSIESPKWIIAGDRGEVFEKLSEDIFPEFKQLTGWNIEDISFLNELIEGSWADDISDFEYENEEFQCAEANPSNDLSDFVGATGIWIISLEDCSASFEYPAKKITINDEDTDDVFDFLSSNGRQHGFVVKQG